MIGPPPPRAPSPVGRHLKPLQDQIQVTALVEGEILDPKCLY